MHRFFVPVEWIQPPLVRFQKETAHQMVSVLRLNRGDIVIALDGNGFEMTVRLTLVDRERVDGEIIATHPTIGEARTYLSLYISMTQREKLEWILQKGTEMGVSAFIPVITTRSLVRETSGDPRKVIRWENILREASEQSGRGRVPKMRPILSYSNALSDGRTNHGLCLLPWEREIKNDLKDSLSTLPRDKPAKVAILIGPEGGFSDDEAGQAIEKGWLPISLGARILRMETAALVTIALVFHELGDFKPITGAATGS